MLAAPFIPRKVTCTYSRLKVFYACRHFKSQLTFSLMDTVKCITLYTWFAQTLGKLEASEKRQSPSKASAEGRCGIVHAVSFRGGGLPDGKRHERRRPCQLWQTIQQVVSIILLLIYYPGEQSPLAMECCLQTSFSAGVLEPKVTLVMAATVSQLCFRVAYYEDLRNLVSRKLSANTATNVISAWEI